MDNMKIDWGPAADVRAPAPEIVIIPDSPAELCPELGPVAADAVVAPVPVMPMSAPVVVPVPAPVASVRQTPPSPQPNNRLGLGVGIGVGVVAAVLAVWGVYVALGAASSAVESAWNTTTRTLPWLALIPLLWLGWRVSRVSARGGSAMAREAARGVGQLAYGAGWLAAGVGRASMGAARLATGAPAPARLAYGAPAWSPVPVSGWRARVAGAVVPAPVAIEPEIEWVDEAGNPVPVGTPVAWDAHGNPSQWAGVAISPPVTPSPAVAAPESMTRGAAVLTRLFGAPDADRSVIQSADAAQVVDTRDPSMDWSFADWLFDESAPWAAGDGRSLPPGTPLSIEDMTLTTRWCKRMRASSAGEEVHGQWSQRSTWGGCRFCAVGLLFDESDPDGWDTDGSIFTHRDRDKLLARYGREFLMGVSNGFETQGWSMNDCAAFVEARQLAGQVA
jgi:hypothetical protein